MTRPIALASGLVGALAAIAVVFLVGMRRKSPVVLGAVRRLNRAVINPQQMKSAGTPGAYAAIIRHTGRTSGRQYETPVGAVATVDGFVIGLPYGTQADWLQNVLASGSATIVHEGETHEVDRPEVLPIDTALTYFTESDTRTFRLFGVDHCLRVRHATSA